MQAISSYFKIIKEKINYFEFPFENTVVRLLLPNLMKYKYQMKVPIKTPRSGDKGVQQLFADIG